MFFHCQILDRIQRACALLTRIPASWEYVSVAGSSFVFPIVINMRERRLKTSARRVSKRLLETVSSTRTSFSFVTVENVGSTKVNDRDSENHGPCSMTP